jgi:hypothetical protein
MRRALLERAAAAPPHGAEEWSIPPDGAAAGRSRQRALCAQAQALTHCDDEL